MNTNHRPTVPRRYERTLYAYSSALDRGDFATVAKILAQAADDPALERLILDLNAAHAAELGVTMSPTVVPRQSIPSKEKIMLAPKSLTIPPMRTRAIAVLLVVILTSLTIMLVLSSNRYTFLIALSTPTLAPSSTPTSIPQPANATSGMPITVANVSSLDISRILGRGYFSGGFAWSGRWLAVTSPIGISLFDMNDLSAPPLLLTYQADTLGFSADGNTLITAAMVTGGSEVTGTITRWEVATHRLISTSTFPLGTDGAWFADFVADNTLLPYSWEGKIRFYNLLTNTVDLELSSAEPLRPTSVMLSPDKKYAAVGTVDNRLHIWDTAKPDQEKYSSADAQEQIYSMTFTPDSRYLITADNRISTLRKWDMVTDKQIPLETVNGSVFDIEFSPDGNLYVTANQNGSINLYNAETNSRIISLTGHPPVTTEGRAVARLVFNADGSRLASIGDNGIIKVWDMRGGQEIATLDSQSVCPDQLGYSDDGKRLLATCEDSVQVWDVANAKLLFTTRTDIADINSARISPDGKLVAFTENRGILQLWDIDANKRMLIHEIKRVPSSQVTNGGGTFTSRLSFSHDGQWLAFANVFDSAIWLYNLASGQEQAMTGHTQVINGLQFSLDDRSVLSFSGDGSVRLWNIPAATLRAVSDNTAAHPVAAAQFSPDGSLIAVTYADSTLALLDAQTLAPQTTLYSPPAGNDSLFYSGLAFTPDGRVLASFSMPMTSVASNTVTFWDVQAKKQIGTLTIPISYLRSMALSEDGTQLAFSVGGTVMFYQIES